MELFQGFSQESVDFLWGIRLNNERSWFLAHKEDYQRHVDGPLRQLAAQIGQQMSEEFPSLGLQVRVSRIYRDARRLHGRGPYKDCLWFSLHRPEDSDGREPGFYFELSPQYYGYGMGCYAPTPLTMAKLRARIDRDPKPLERLTRALNQRSEFTLEGAEYKRPKGDPGALLSVWYNRRQITLSTAYNCDGLLFTPELEAQVMGGFRFLVPYYQYLRSLSGDPAPAGSL